MGAISHKFPSLYNPDIVEVKALAYALQWARKMCFEKLSVEGDSLNLMNVLSKGFVENASERRMLVMDMLSLKS